MSEKFNGPPVKQDANGEWPADVKKFSAYDSDRQTAFFKEKSAIVKPYKTGDYAKTAWAGKLTDVSKPAYTGNTDGSRYRTQSNIQHNDAHEASTSGVATNDYQTGSYKTSAANENQAKRLDKPSDAATESRRHAYPEPEITSWKQQRALDMKTTRGFLGRE